MVAAVQNGANAVYLGGSAFSARAGAENFSTLTEAVDYCHARDVRVHLAANTLVRHNETEALEELLMQAADAGVDALIIQDLAVWSAARACLPEMELHASTQMSLMGAGGARQAAGMGFSRVIAARESSLEAIEEMAQILPVEVFVQGALCVCYSGQCLMSSMLGGRSGNRGRCAQPCRLPYEIEGKKGYWLSPRDLCTLADIPALMQAGATSFKIEGRLRRPEYVALATAAYRRAIDAAAENMPFDDTADRNRLSSVFHRGYYTRGYALGDNDARLMYPKRPNHGGLEVGSTRLGGLQLDFPLHAGDSVEMRPSGKGFLVDKDMPMGFVPYRGVIEGEIIYRTNDAELMEKARRSYEGERRIHPVAAQLILKPGRPAKLTLGNVAVEGEVVQAAKSNPITYEQAKKQIGKLGDAAMALEDFEYMPQGGFLPVSSLNALRRRAVEILLQKSKMKVIPLPPLPAKKDLPKSRQLILQSSNVELLRRSDAPDLRYYSPVDWDFVSLCADINALDGCAYLCLPFWLEGEQLEQIYMFSNGKVKGYVVGGIAQLDAPGPVIADYSLYAFSPRGALALMELGCERVTLSPELTAAQMGEITPYVPSEAIIHGDLPLMTLAHCPLRSSRGMDGRGRENCNLCKGKLPALVDRRGESFAMQRIKASDGCRVLVHNAHHLSMLGDLNALERAGLSALRVITNEETVIAAYAAALQGGGHGEIKNEKPTKGHFFRGVE